MPLQKRKTSHENISNKSGPNIDHCGAPTTMFRHELNLPFILTLCLPQLNNYLLVSMILSKNHMREVLQL